MSDDEDEIFELPLKKEERTLPEDDIFEKMDFNHEATNTKISQLQKDLKTSLTSGSSDQQMLAYNQLGIGYFRLFCYDKAELCHHQHLQLSYPYEPKIAIQKPRPENKNEQKIALVNLGAVYKANSKYELALQTYRTAIIIAEELSDASSKARILNNMSNVYEKTYDFESAIECEKQRFEIATDIADVNGQIKSAAALGSLHQLTGDLRDAIAYYDKAVINLRMKILKKQMVALEIEQT